VCALPPGFNASNDGVVVYDSPRNLYWSSGAIPIDLGARRDNVLSRILRIRVIAVALALAAGTIARAETDRTDFLSLLHDGRFAVAREALRRNGPPVEAEDLFFDAFVTYWQTVFDDENPGLQVELEDQLGSAIRAAKGGDVLWGGSSHLLLAGVRASQRRPLAAAQEAKKAKRLLESATSAGADTTDALFGLGTYNYVADTVPSYVKGLRALLFLPKGDRTLGLSQLSTAAETSRYFALEARTLLITIYANKHERRYREAVAERDRLLASWPDTIASSYASARLDLSLGRYESAIERLARAEERARGFGDVDPVVSSCIELLRARVELAAWRPDRAQKTAERALSVGRGLSPSIRDDIEAVRSSAARQAAGIDWPTTEEQATFEALASAQPNRPILALLAGDAALRAGKASDALRWFSRAAASGLPAELQPGCKLRQGQAEDLLGHRDSALVLYKSVAGVSGFIARDGAYYYQQSPYPISP
jgi:tetratricopeptide (TPR) repeat protein